MKKIPRFITPLTASEAISALIPRNREERYGVEPVRVFTRRFAQHIGVAHAVPAPSARVALIGILHALDLPRNGEVILPSLTHHSVPVIFEKFGLQPRFVDINPSTYCIDTDRLEAAVTSSTVAVFPVHLYGRACNMDAIGQIAERHGLVVLEDCAQCCGCSYRGKRLGSFGRAAIFSFGPTKNLSLLGAGMVVTDSQSLAEKTADWMNKLPLMGRATLAKRLLLAMGMNLVTKPRVWNGIMFPLLVSFTRWGIDPIEIMTNEAPGSNRRADRQARLMPRPLQWRIGLDQLEKLDASNLRRIRNGDLLLKYLWDMPDVEIPSPSPEGENIYMSFVVKVGDRETFRRRMLSLGVDTHGGNMFVGPDLPGFKGTGEAESAAEALRHMVHLPVYPEMSESDVARVADAVRRAILGD